MNTRLVDEGVVDSHRSSTSARSKWTVLEVRRTIRLELEDADALVRDIATWPLWNPTVAQTTTPEGSSSSSPGVMSRVVLGERPLRAQLWYMQVATDRKGTTVFAGNWGRYCRFIDVVEMSGRGSSTDVIRRVELMVTGPLRMAHRALTRVARSRVRRTFDLLS